MFPVAACYGGRELIACNSLHPIPRVCSCAIASHAITHSLYGDQYHQPTYTTYLHTHADDAKHQMLAQQKQCRQYTHTLTHTQIENRDKRTKQEKWWKENSSGIAELSKTSFGLVKMAVNEACSVLGKAKKPAPFPRLQKQPTEEPAYYRCHRLRLRCARCNQPTTHTQKQRNRKNEKNRGGRDTGWGASTLCCTNTHTHTHTHVGAQNTWQVRIMLQQNT